MMPLTLGWRGKPSSNIHGKEPRKRSLPLFLGMRTAGFISKKLTRDRHASIPPPLTNSVTENIALYTLDIGINEL